MKLVTLSIPFCMEVNFFWSSYVSIIFCHDQVDHILVKLIKFTKKDRQMREDIIRFEVGPWGMSYDAPY